MIKIDYPFNKQGTKIKKGDFNARFYERLKKWFDVNAINLLLENFLIDGHPLNLEILLTSDFNRLLKIKNLIEASSLKANINEHFYVRRSSTTVNLYENAKGHISQFFVAEHFSFKTCHYCNIDHINVFEERHSYATIEEFINSASKEVLQQLDVISEQTAKTIVMMRQWNNWIMSQLKFYLSKRIYEKVHRRMQNNRFGSRNYFDHRNIVLYKNHFTIDHFLPKIEFPYLALSLYNLVPCCSSCNTKFKGALEFETQAKLDTLSPTSDNFRICSDLNFVLYFNVKGLSLDYKINNVKSLNDFEIRIEDRSKSIGFNTYINMFKLTGRYEFHRGIALNMIVKRKSYSDSQIKEFSILFNKKGIQKDFESIKKDLFGTSVFNDDEKGDAFAKYKRDIEKQLEL